jgi:hypothetical protein
MTYKHTALYAAMFSAMIGLAACSGGSGSSGTSNGATGSNTTGRITGFGSVYVNGVEYDTDGANITIDGVVSTETDLAVGMLVNVDGTENGATGTALSVSFVDNVEGVVTQTVAGGGLVVMGHTITTDSQTNLDGLTDVANLAIGDVVEVSGYPDATGGILATYIELNGTYTPGDEIEVKGLVSNLTATTFTIGSMTVDYSSATSVDAGLADGAYVEVKGDSAPVADTFMATSIEAEQHGVSGDDGDELEVEGLITDIASDGSTISINGQTFAVPTDFDVNTFSVGDMVEVEVTVSGTDLVLSDIDDEDHDSDNVNKIEVKATTTATDTVANTLTVAGLTISVDPNTTIMIDHSANPEHFFNLGSITGGTDLVKVEAIPDGNGGYLATRIERVDGTSASVEIEGPAVVDGITSAISIAGIMLDVTTNSIDTSTVAGSSKVQVNGELLQDGSILVTALQAE